MCPQDGEPAWLGEHDSTGASLRSANKLIEVLLQKISRLEMEAAEFKEYHKEIRKWKRGDNEKKREIKEDRYAPKGAQRHACDSDTMEPESS